MTRAGAYRRRHACAALAVPVAACLALAGCAVSAPSRAGSAARHSPASAAAGTGAGRSLAARGPVVTVQAAVRLKQVSYLGYQFEIPRSWPVINLAIHPATCVRFDVHAFYVGVPGADENCPAWLLGATEAVVIQPAAKTARRTSVENPVADQITATAPGISLTATYGSAPAVILGILASAGLPRPRVVQPDPAGPAAVDSAPHQGADAGSGPKASAGRSLAVSGRRIRTQAAAGFGHIPLPALPMTVANKVGLGFDACAAPSAAVMAAWRRSSPYSAVGVYIGGADRACDQPNLTPGWVRLEAASGWRFIAMYAGPQASFGQLSRPGKQGTAAARDAVAQAERLGFGPGTPLYYDMEAYPARYTLSVLRFLSAWTKELDKLGYASGVYSSSDAAVQALARAYRGKAFAVPDVIYDALWNGEHNVIDSVYGPGEWPGRHRLHQFAGNVLQTYGGDTIEIDQDYLDLGLYPGGGTMQAAPGATGSSGSAEVFYAGAGHQLWEESRNSAGQWTHTDLGGYVTATPTVVRVGTAELDVLYRGAGGYLWLRVRIDGRWRPATRLTVMGQLGGAPRAVAQPNGVIDVFWQGAHDDHLWHAQYSPGEGWTGPQNLGGSLASMPYPVETGTGVVEVFWKGNDSNLWRVMRGVGLGWTRPQNLGMGHLGGAPQAVALSNGEIDVFWSGDTSPHHIWSCFIVPGRPVVGPVGIGGTISGQPWPVVGADSELVLFRGPGGNLWQISRLADGSWAAPVRIGAVGVLQSAPFAATGDTSDQLVAFWLGSGGTLWTSAKSGRNTNWQGPKKLGGTSG
jgi:hypothetical protein